MPAAIKEAIAFALETHCGYFGGRGEAIWMVKE